MMLKVTKKKVLNDKIKVQKAFKEKGFFVLDTSKVYQDIKSFFLDICSFFVLIIRDDRRFIKHADSIDQSILSQDIKLIDKKIQKAIFEIQKIDRTLLGKIYEMGTHPNKFLSGEKLFFNKEIVRISKYFFDSKSRNNKLLVKPKKGETLHLFTPGENQFKYNLPIHQDYQYLGQSSEQLTFWLFLTGDKDSGGIRLFPGTHKLGPLECVKNKYGHLEVVSKISSNLKADEAIDFYGKQFQIIAIDSLLLHQSLRSSSSKSSRLTYIWRLSNLNSDSRRLFGESF